jgi:hypothetical protein
MLAEHIIEKLILNFSEMLESHRVINVNNFRRSAAESGNRNESLLFVVGKETMRNNHYIILIKILTVVRNCGWKTKNRAWFLSIIKYYIKNV